jgi:hypothetical protein
MKPTQEQVEQWAKAVWIAGDMYIGPDTGSLMHFANLAFAAGQASKGPEGWKMVPVEPTLEMINAGNDGFRSPESRRHTVSSCYRAMLAAAPSQEVGES